jgi:hypothetical protein
MRPRHQRLEVAQLLDTGLSDGAVARATGVPRATVRDWRTAGVQDEATTARCPRCDGDAHDPALLDRPAYAYLLGLYLGDVVVSQYARTWPCLLPQHGPGLKHERPIVLRGWQETIVAEHPNQLIRGLLHSDGCRSLNRVVASGKTYAYVRYQFSNRSDDIHGLFCEALDRLEIPWRRMNRWNISIARREGVAALDRFVEAKD